MPTIVQQPLKSMQMNANDQDFPQSAIHLQPLESGVDSPVKFPLIHKLTASESVLAIEVDDDCLYAGLNTGDIAIWSLETARLVDIVRGHDEAVLCLCLSDDKSRLFSAGSDSMLNVWSTQDLELLYSIRSEPRVGDIFALAYSADRNTIYCGAQNQSIQWYHFGDESELLRPPLPSKDNMRSKFFDSASAANGIKPNTSTKSSKKRGAKVKAKQQLWFQPANIQLFAHGGAIQCMLLLRKMGDTHISQEQRLVSGGSDGYVKLWGLGNRNEPISCRVKLRNSRLPVYSMALSGDLLYCGLAGGYVNVFNAESKQLVYSLSIGDGDVLATSIINGSAFCGTSNGLVKQIDSSLSGVHSWASNSGKVLASRTSRQGSREAFVTGGNDNCIYFWDVGSIVEQPKQRSSSNDEMMRQLCDFISYRTVSSDHRCKASCNEIATSLRKCFIQNGAAETALLATETAMNPITFARFRSSNRSNAQSEKTVMFYGHYDVVNAEPQSSSWKTDPFDAVAINGYLYGRGATDNKGPMAAAMFAVFELRRAKILSCNVVFVIEGEEENGSRGFTETIRANKGLIGQVDYVLVANSYWLDDAIPCLTYGMRGVIHAIITIRSNLPDRHSGVEGKASAHEALKDLTVVLGSLVGPDGTDIQIPNFYDGAVGLNETERSRFRAITAALQPSHPEIEDPQAYTESLIQRWSNPNLTIHGIKVPKSKNAVTIPSFAEAAVSIRIVPGQRADDIAEELQSYVEKQFNQMNSSNKIKVRVPSKADAWLGDPSNALFQTLEHAVTKAWKDRSSLPKHGDEKNSPVAKVGGAQTKPIYIREGGSIPAISFLEKEFQAPAAMFPCGQASDNAHLDNEHIRIENLYAAKQVFGTVFSEL